MIDWVVNNLELFAAITGLIYIFLSVYESPWLWPVGISTSALYIWVFYDAKFYADSGLQVYYLVVSVYGWWFWLKKLHEQKSDKTPISMLNLNGWVLSILATLVLFAIMAFILDNYTDSPLPYWDAFTTAGSITATYLLARKVLDHWKMWIVIDLVSAGLYIYKELYPTVILFAIYTIMAVVGFYQWKKSFNNQLVDEKILSKR